MQFVLVMQVGKVCAVESLMVTLILAIMDAAIPGERSRSANVDDGRSSVLVLITVVSAGP